MGRDICSIVQVRRKQTSQWETVGKEVAGDQRCYTAFALLSQVSGSFRGLPSDIQTDDFDCVDNVWLGDHSHSWLTLDEIDLFIEKHDAKALVETARALQDIAEQQGVCAERMRYVFGFSS